ncbi:peptidylprolyl isomerase [Nocardioides sp.]|uniref:peptidylprolyl isomerase n=1 Tax=Nocardioides sp. TaxID=35761 RepID=UPI0039E34654
MLKRALLPLGPTLVLVAALTACGSAEDSDATSTASEGPACTYTADGTDSGVDLPPGHAEETGDVPVTITTTVGDLNLTLDAESAPCTVNSFLSLAKQGFYDNTSCHRLGVSTGFSLLQCGDPSGDGTGGPGYQFDDELTGAETYPAGTVAMANAGANTNGSQFFLVFGDTQLEPSYTVFGHFDDATTQILAGVGAAGNDGAWGDGTGRPNTPVTFQKITVG